MKMLKLQFISVAILLFVCQVRSSKIPLEIKPDLTVNPQEEEVTAKKTILGRFKGLNPFKGKEKSQAQIDEKKELETFQKEIEPAKLESNGNKKEVSPFKNGKFAKNESLNDFSADELKKIVYYCKKYKSKKDKVCKNFYKALLANLLNCEKQPKTDKICQTFKVKFCQAYSHLRYCPGLIDGKDCKGHVN